MPHRGHNRIRRIERGIDLSAGRNRTLGLANIVGQLFRELHRPRDIRRASVKLTIDEIGAAPKKQTDRRCHHQVIAEIRP